MVSRGWHDSPGSGMISRLHLIHRNQGLILEVARIRSLSQELCSAYLLVELNMSTPEALLEGGAEGSREGVVKNGSGSLKMNPTVETLV